MIRLSQRIDINEIILLWNESFGDSFDNIKFFLDEKYIPENTVVCECDGKIVSVLFLLDGEMYINGTEYPSYYLYAACTLNKYRGRGIMSDMLEYAKRLSCEHGKYFIALKPGEKSLYDFYSKYGYKAFYTKKILKTKFNYLTKQKISSVFSVDYSHLRDKVFKNINYFKWDRKSIDFAIRYHMRFGGEFFASADGYLLYTIDNNSIHVIENTFESIDKIFYALNQNSLTAKCDSIQIDLPIEYSVNDCEIVNSGMILPLNNDAEKIINNLNNAYLNLTLD